MRSHYNRNQEYYKEKAKRREILVRTLVHEFIAGYFMSHPCVDCGEKDILVLEFDHRSRQDKLDDVAGLVRKGYSSKSLINEIAKCDVRCSNCHRRKTERETGSWRLKYAPVA